MRKMPWSGSDKPQPIDERAESWMHLHSTSVSQNVAQVHRRLLAWSDNEPFVDWLYVVVCLFLTCMAGLMSGLTLGLLSLDTVDLEVLLRSGTRSEQKYARKIMPIISKSHLLLVTLLTCNAVAMEALPLFLDKLADPVTAVAVSVTAVLFFGEIIPQSVCSRYGLAIGATLAPLVRLLMWLCSPVAWPMAKLLDLLIGPDHHTLFRRRQLKELVSIHAEDAGMGGALTRDEIKVITGALDLTSKIAYRAMTPLDKVFMLSSSDRLDESTLRSILRSGHSRIPVHQEGDRGDVVGLVLVKELLQYRLGSSEDVPVSMLRIRSIPRLPATTRMYDMLRLFQTGRSHIAVLTQPPPGELERLLALDASLTTKRSETGRSRNASKAARLGPEDLLDRAGGAGHGDGGGGGSAAAATTTPGSAFPADAGAADTVDGLAAAARRAAAATSTHDDARSVAAETEGDVDGYIYYTPSGGIVDASYPASAMDPSEAAERAAALMELPASFRHWGMPDFPRGEYDDSVASSGGGGGGGGRPGAQAAASMVDAPGSLTLAPALAQTSSHGQLSRLSSASAFAAAAEAAAAAAAPQPQAEPAGAATAVAGDASTQISQQLQPAPHPHGGGHRLTRMGAEASAAAAAAAAAVALSTARGSSEAGRGGGSASATPGCSIHSGSAALAALSTAEALGAYRGEDATTAAAVTAAASGAATCGGGADADGTDATRTAEAAGGASAAHRDFGGEVEEGRPIGIITIEDVIEELIRAEIVDETDRYIDNNRLIRANHAQLAKTLPEHLAKVLAAAGAGKKALHRSGSTGHTASPGITPARRSYATGLGLGLGGGSGASTARDLSTGAHSGSMLRVPLLQGEQF